MVQPIPIKKKCRHRERTLHCLFVTRECRSKPSTSKECPMFRHIHGARSVSTGRPMPSHDCLDLLYDRRLLHIVLEPSYITFKPYKSPRRHPVDIKQLGSKKRKGVPYHLNHVRLILCEDHCSCLYAQVEHLLILLLTDTNLSTCQLHLIITVTE